MSKIHPEFPKKRFNDLWVEMNNPRNEVHKNLVFLEAFVLLKTLLPNENWSSSPFEPLINPHNDCMNNIIPKKGEWDAAMTTINSM